MFEKRLASGVVLVIAAVALLGWGGVWLLLALLAISLVAFLELAKAMGVAGQGGLQVLEVLAIGGTILYYATMQFSGGELAWMLFCLIGVFMSMMLAYVLLFPKIRAEQVAMAYFAYLYGPMLLSFIYMTRMSFWGFHLVWLILIGSWGSDTSAYVVGMLIGRRKIFPLLSPKKSLEGCLGGIGGAALLAGGYGYFLSRQGYGDFSLVWILGMIGAVASLASQVGDLAASAIKRNFQIKDYGNLIPGHGGIMDRFDSMIATAPMIYFLSRLLLEFPGLPHMGRGGF